MGVVVLSLMAALTHVSLYLDSPDDPETSQERSRAPVSSDEGNLKGHVKEEPDSSEVGHTETPLDEDFLIPTLESSRQHLQISAMSGGYMVEPAKDLSGSKARRLGESNMDAASSSISSPMYCSKCKKMFATGEAYGRHEPMHLLNIKLFSCTECGKYYRNNTALVIHRRTHTGEKPYCCSECGRCFNARSSLVTHGKIHSGEKLYSCSECGKGFTKTDDLFNHQLVHYRERKYTCGDCGKCFKAESELVVHRRSHPVEELFLCSVCGKDFTQYSKLLRHEKTHPKPPPVFITSEKMLKDQEA